METSSLVATQASELLHAWERLRWDLLDAIDHSVSALAACQDLPRRGRAKKEGEAEQGGLLPTIATAWPQLMRASEGRARGVPQDRSEARVLWRKIRHLEGDEGPVAGAEQHDRGR